MDHLKVYRAIITKFQNDFKENCYKENHHILPACMGGSKESQNMVLLPAREHFIVHQLLLKIYPDIPGLIYAAFRMSQNKRYSSREYSWLREKYILSMKGKKRHPVICERISSSKKGKSISVAGRKSKKGKVVKAFVEANIARRGIKKPALSELLTGRVLSDEHRNNISEGRKKLFRDRKFNDEDHE